MDGRGGRSGLAGSRTGIFHITQPLELILARNLISGVSLAAFLVDPDGVLVFFNDAAGELIGRRFEDVGRLRREEWASEFGPFDAFGKLIPPDERATSEALRRGLPAHGRFLVRAREEMVEMDVSALPLSTADGFKGVIVALWPANHAGSAAAE